MYINTLICIYMPTFLLKKPPKLLRSLWITSAYREKWTNFSGNFRLVPALWLYEVGNTLARRFPDEAARLLAALMKLELEELAPSRRWLEAVLKLTRGHGVTFYDAAYHAIAIMHKGDFVTADERYANRVVEMSSIVLLRDWSQTR